MIRLKQVLAFTLSWGLLLATSPASPDAWASVAIHPPILAMQEAPQAALSASQIDELVSPIALYPDALVAQILAASTYPDQVVTANSWLQANSELERRPTRRAGEWAVLGPQRESSDPVPFRAVQHGDRICPGRRLWAMPSTTSRPT